jgi:general secretion pathway protein A
MDVLQYFRLNEQPFRIGPDPRFLYLSDQVKEAIAKCEYMARERIGPIYIYGPIGAGKTSILRRLYERLGQEEKYNVALLISPNVKTSNAFLRMIMEAYNVKTERSYDQSLKNFEEFLAKEYKTGRIPLLLVDEAQNLTRDVLKLIHYLLNFETATTKLLQIVLVGQEELAARIVRYQELASRMFPIAISAMSPEELEEMIRFRWMVAGGKEVPFITSDGKNVYKTLYAYTKGLPRETVKVCDELLRDLLVKNKKVATAAEVEQIAKELNLRL